MICCLWSTPVVYFSPRQQDKTMQRQQQEQEEQEQTKVDNNADMDDFEFPQGEWSGLESAAMQDAKSSLLLPCASERHYQPRIKYLAPRPRPRKRILVYQDAAIQPAVGLHGGKSFHVDFGGAVILQLEAKVTATANEQVTAKDQVASATIQNNMESNIESNSSMESNDNDNDSNSNNDNNHYIQYKTMPVTLTVAGRCTFTTRNYKDFAMMMRSRDQAAAIDVPPNGTLDWPDVEALLLCPVCGTYQDIPPTSESDSDDCDDTESNNDDDDNDDEYEDDDNTTAVHDNNNHGGAGGDTTKDKDKSLQDGQQQQHNHETQYWMLFYPIFQIQIGKANKLIMACRTICRLVCLDCMQDLVEGLYLPPPKTKRTTTTTTTTTRKKQQQQQQESKTDDNGFPIIPVKEVAVPTPAPAPQPPQPPLSVMDLLEHVGSVVFLQDNPPRPEHAPHIDDDLDAWSLYQLWEHSGAWEALQNDYKECLINCMKSNHYDIANNNNNQHVKDKKDGVAGMHETKKPDPPAFTIMTSVAAAAKDRSNRKCDNPTCGLVHGTRDFETDNVVSLHSVACEKCNALFHYCSTNKSCRKAAVDNHLKMCFNHSVSGGGGGGGGVNHDKTLEKKVPCSVCQKVLPCTRMKKCSKCRIANYCSVSCQRQDWPSHKTICAEVQ